jgi:hypothetical protein
MTSVRAGQAGPQEHSSAPESTNPRTWRLSDIWWHIEPVSHPSIHVSWLHFTIIAGIGGLWMAYFFNNLRSRPLLALNAPQTLRFLEPSHE